MNPHVSAGTPERHRSLGIAVATLFLVGMNLRPALSSVSPLLETVRISMGLTSAGAGALMTLPVLCFGVFAFIAPYMARVCAVERIILYSLLSLALSIVLRVTGEAPALFVGTLFAGASIGVIMALLPGVIKRDYPDNTLLSTGVYTLALNFGGALGAAASIPLQSITEGNWKMALALWGLPAAIAAYGWVTAFGRHHASPTLIIAPQAKPKGLVKNALAWQVTAYMAFQSALAYCVFGWLPTILADRGMTAAAAGFALSLSIAGQWITSLTAPWISTRGKDQRAAIAVLLSLTVTGFLGCVYGSTQFVWLWTVLLGIGQGGTFSIAMALIVFRSSNASVAGSLSSMVQGIGYCIAALAPLGVGLLHNRSGDWHLVTVGFVITAFLALIAAIGAGRNCEIKLKADAP